jgi:transketolase
VHVVLEGGKRLTEEGVRVRVVSMPIWELFEKAPRDYKDQLLLADVKVQISVEAGITMG